MYKQKNYICVKNIFKIGFIVLLIYFIITISFYFLAGEQLKLRDSRGSVEMPTADAFTTELTEGTIIEQTFTSNIQIFESISILWGDYFRDNYGIVNVELYDMRDNSLIVNKKLDVSIIDEGMITEIKLDKSSETLYGAPMLIRITSNSVAGSAVTPLMSSAVQRDGEQLTINGEIQKGTLCFSANGKDYIWTGIHYWKFVITGIVIIILCYIVILYRIKTGKHSYTVNAIIALRKYKFLIRQLVSRDFKTKYKRSVLGVLWSFLNPLLMMSVQYFVFSTIFKSDIPNYPVYLLIGIVSFNFFSEACGMSLTSIIGNANLITKVYVPKYIYPLTRVMSSVINLLISFIPLIIMMIFTKVEFQKSAILSSFFFLCVIIFSLGLGMLLASLMVFFRDTQFLWGVINTIWMYMTPIFYPDTIVPQEFKGILQINPLYHFVTNTRLCILYGISPEPMAYVQCFLIAIIMLLIGAWVFKKSQDRFVLYL